MASLNRFELSGALAEAAKQVQEDHEVVRFKLVFQGLKSDGNPEQLAHVLARNPALMKLILSMPTRLAVVARGRVACDENGQLLLEAYSVQPISQWNTKFQNGGNINVPTTHQFVRHSISGSSKR